MNTGTVASFDGINGGPVGFIRNIAINQTRGPFKLTSSAAGLKLLNNTVVCATKTTDFGLYTASSTAYNTDYRNNVLVYRGASNVIQWGTDQPFPMDHNGWYPNRNFNIGGGGYANLAAAQAAQPTRWTGDVIVASDPFATAITLGSTYVTEYIGQVNATLFAGSSAKNAGVAIAGVTDGFTGAAPDMGAVISGQGFGTVGCAWASVTPG
jgi:hypothetical protein